MNAFIRTTAAAVLLFVGLAANAKPAAAPTPQQRQAAQKLAGISVRILDLSRLFRYDGSPDSRYKPFQAIMTSEEFRCFTTKMGTPQGFRAYKMDEALDYVQHRSPQDLQRDFALGRMESPIITTIGTYRKWRGCSKIPVCSMPSAVLWSRRSIMICGSCCFRSHSTLRLWRT